MGHRRFVCSLEVTVDLLTRERSSVIRTGLISGKLSQTTQTFHVIRALPRSFGDEEWRVLERRLVAWRVGLEGVRGVLAQTARQSQGHGQSAIAAGQAAAEALA
jgi:translation initiation factor 3 subunit M